MGNQAVFANDRAGSRITLTFARCVGDELSTFICCQS